MKDLPDYFRAIDASYARDCVENRIRMHGDLGSQVSEFVGHLGQTQARKSQINEPKKELHAACESNSSMEMPVSRESF